MQLTANNKQPIGCEAQLAATHIGREELLGRGECPDRHAGLQVSACSD